ncbi:MAG: chromosome segregation protein SMC, partial [Bacteroidetes bacterium]|nr:chromosome segregation protein SMC [Bacteroidota bacterium]
MYISELELHGFKSFAHKTHVKFDNGITAIVGPNGCGKSNIVDALRWVLGEQRPTLLRSSSMSNVIFNGTAQKKALGMAEVSLTFVNNKGLLPVEYSELTITRRLYRSGDSEYLINNTACRLKDIMELFMDTGMSSDAYSVIELKMVEEILNDKNNDRRRLFEEAAGVTRYKEQRKRTLRKLDDTLKDLQRLEDILVEIRKNVRSLERQAEKASKAKELRNELEHLDKACALKEYNSIADEIDPLKERIENAEKEKKEISERLMELETAEEKSRTLLIEKERNESEAKRRAGQLHTSIRETETQLQILREKISNEEGVIRRYNKEIEQSEVDIRELKEHRETNEAKLEEFTDQMKRSEASLAESKERFSEVQKAYTELRHELYELEIALSDAGQKLNQIQSKRIKLESNLENSADDQERINRDIRDYEKEIEKATHNLDIHREESEEIEHRIDSKEADLQKSTQEKEKLEQKREVQRDSIRSLKSQKDAVTSEISLLQSISQSSDALPSSVSYLLENHEDDFSLLEPISRLFQTSEEYAPALEAALGDAVHFLVTEDLEDAYRASEILKENKKGRATFIPLSRLKAAYPVDKLSIAKQVQCEEPYRPVAQLLLGTTLLAKDLDEAGRFLTDQGTSAVTTEGDLMTAEGILKSGSKNSDAGIRLGLQDKLDKLHSKLNSLESELEKEENDLDQTQIRLRELNLDSIRKEIRELQKEARENDQKISRFQSGIQVYEKNIGELKSRRETLAGSRSEAAEELENLEPRQA